MRLAVLGAAGLPCRARRAAAGTAPGLSAGSRSRGPQRLRISHTLYSQNCAACHGANGQNGPAIDLGNPEYQALVDDATLRKWISGGMPGTEMPAFAQSAGGMLTDAQVNALIAGMRKEWSQPNVFAGATPPPYAQIASGDAHARPASLSGALRIVPCSRRARTSPAPIYLVARWRPGAAQHHHRRTPGHRPAGLAA